jgi:hypothetical protein
MPSCHNHQRSLVTTSDKPLLVPRNETHEDTEHGAEAIRAVGGQFNFKGPHHESNTPPGFGSGIGIDDSAEPVVADSHNTNLIELAKLRYRNDKAPVSDTTQEAKPKTSAFLTASPTAFVQNDLSNAPTPAMASSYLESNIPKSSSKEDLIIFKKNDHERPSSRSSNDSGSTVASDNWNVVDTEILSPSITPGKEPLPSPESEARLGPMRFNLYTGSFSHSTTPITPEHLTMEEARGCYSLLDYTMAGPIQGVQVHDFASISGCTFSVPSMSESASSADSKASTGGPVDLTEYPSVVQQNSDSFDDTLDQSQDGMTVGEGNIALPLVTWTPCTPRNSGDGNCDQTSPTFQEGRLTVPLSSDDELFEAEMEAHPLPLVPKAEAHEPKQTHSNGLLRRISECVGRFIVAHSNADIVHPNANTAPTTQPMMHSNVSIEDHDLQSSDCEVEQNQRGAPMPMLTDRPDVPKNKRSGPCGKLRGVFGRKGSSKEEGDKVRKESLARRFNVRLKAFHLR